MRQPRTTVPHALLSGWAGSAEGQRGRAQEGHPPHAWPSPCARPRRPSLGKECVMYLRPPLLWLAVHFQQQRMVALDNQRVVWLKALQVVHKRSSSLCSRCVVCVCTWLGGTHGAASRS